MAGTREVRVLVLGNSFAEKVQLPVLRWLGGNRVVGIAGADADKARATAERWSIPRSSGDWRELLELEFDLALVATPVHLHAPMVRALLETPAAILCEKPFALDAGEARELADAGRGRLCLLDHQLRWSPWRRRLGALVHEGFLGEPWHGRTRMVLGGARRREAPWTWWYDAERGGGVLGAIGSHMIDALQVDLGPVAAVRARLSTFVGERRDAGGVAHAVTADEHAELWLRMESGAEIALETSVASPATRISIEYVGSEGSLRLEDEERLFAARSGEPWQPVAVEDAVPSPEELGTSVYGGMFPRLLPLYLREVLAAVRTGAGEVPGAATFADGVATMRVLDAARRSSAEARWIDCRP